MLVDMSQVEWGRSILGRAVNGSLLWGGNTYARGNHQSVKLVTLHQRRATLVAIDCFPSGFLLGIGTVLGCILRGVSHLCGRVKAAHEARKR